MGEHLPGFRVESSDMSKSIYTSGNYRFNELRLSASSSSGRLASAAAAWA